MLSIVVNDALIGIDVMKKYPAFYSRMLVDTQLRMAFLDTLELLEQSRAGELPDYSGPDLINLNFLHRVNTEPIIRQTSEGRLDLIWQKTADWLQKMFYPAALQPDPGYRSGDFSLYESCINLLRSHVEIGEQALDIQLDAVPAAANPKNLNLLLFVSAPAGIIPQFEATIVWGDYQHTAEVNQFGLAQFPPLMTTKVFAPTGELIYDLELRLKQVD